MLLGELNWPAAREQTGKVVVVPLAAFEQHGHHLPLLTDALIGSEIARRAAEALGDDALFLPTLWVGASDHHRAFPGTVSAGATTYTALLEDIVESLIGGGFRRIFLLNAHGGNITPARLALYNVNLRRRKEHPELYLAFASWWQIAAESIAAIPNLQAKHVTHACEQETSMMLCLHPELVTMEDASGSEIPFESAFYVPDESCPSRVEVTKAFEQLTVTGAMGHPEWATTDKGEALYAIAAQEVIALVREFAHWPGFTPPTSPQKT